jgi:hypothetical protein
VCMEVRPFSSSGTSWTSTCSHAVEADNVALALGCNQLSGLMQGRHDDTVEVLRDLVTFHAFSSSREGQYSCAAPCALAILRRAGISTAFCDHDQAMRLALLTSPSVTPGIFVCPQRRPGGRYFEAK